jgi:hypothetical protein
MEAGTRGSRASDGAAAIKHNNKVVMPALVAGIHDFKNAKRKTWMPGTSLGMTILASVPR